MTKEFAHEHVTIRPLRTEDVPLLFAAVRETARNFWKAMGFQDYAMTLEWIRPETKSRQIL